jgi:hypothetical protein
MSDEETKRDLLKDYAHKELREMLENAIKFTALAILLVWTRDHITTSWLKVLITVVGTLCLVPGALLRTICVLTNPLIKKQLIKEIPFLGLMVLRWNVYGLLLIACVLVQLAFIFLLIPPPHL